MNCGIYSITCIVNNKKYIGSSVNLYSREKVHFNKLNKNKHTSKIQSDYNRYGKENFTFEILELLEDDTDLLIERENFWIDNFQSVKEGYNYQIAQRNNLETLNKISRSKTGKKHSDETKELFSKQRSGKNHPNYNKNLKTETKVKISESLSKITLKEGLEIKQLLIDKVKTNVIAEKYNVSKPTIDRIKYGKHPITKYIGKYADWS